MTTTYLQTAIEDALATEQAPLGAALELGDGSPLVRQATESCWERLRAFQAAPYADGSDAKRSADRLRDETRLRPQASGGLDLNPYAGITRPELEAVIRAAYTAHQPPEVLLALWAKEGSTRTVDAPVEVQASSEANARSILRSAVFFNHLGIDHFVVYTEVPGGDNRVVIDDANAPRHEARFAQRVRELVAERFLAEDVTAAVNRELRVTRSGGRFTVQPTTRFYALVLLLVDALFTKHL